MGQFCAPITARAIEGVILALQKHSSVSHGIVTMQFQQATRAKGDHLAEISDAHAVQYLLERLAALRVNAFEYAIEVGGDYNGFEKKREKANSAADDLARLDGKI